LALKLYDLTASAEPIPSERDQNFRLRDGNGDEFVLKIANATENRDVLHMQNQAMKHMIERRAGLFDDLDPCPRVCANAAGEEIFTVSGDDGATHFVRLLSYLPGKPLANVNPHDSDLLFSLGSFLGRFDRVFQGFDHPATRRSFHWDLACCGEVILSQLDELGDSGKRELIQKYLERYRTVTEPKLENLRSSVIHNDPNDYNVLVTPHGRWANRVSGLIDFGDMVFSHSINNLAVSCAYALMAKVDPLAAAVQVVAG